MVADFLGRGTTSSPGDELVLLPLPLPPALMLSEMLLLLVAAPADKADPVVAATMSRSTDLLFFMVLSGYVFAVPASSTPLDDAAVVVGGVGRLAYAGNTATAGTIVTDAGTAAADAPAAGGAAPASALLAGAEPPSDRRRADALAAAVLFALPAAPELAFPPELPAPAAPRGLLGDLGERGDLGPPAAPAERLDTPSVDGAASADDAPVDGDAVDAGSASTLIAGATIPVRVMDGARRTTPTRSPRGLELPLPELLTDVVRWSWLDPL